MSSNNSDWTSLREDRSQINSVAAPLLDTISDITAKLACIEVGNHHFTEIGSYFYQVSIVVMELQTTENYTNARGILLSLQENISFAKDLVTRFGNSTKQVHYLESRSLLEQLEKVIKILGEDLSLILVSDFEDQEYASIAVHALSKEMINFYFDGIHSPQSEKEEPEALDSYIDGPTYARPAQIETDLYSINVEVPLELSWSSVTRNPYQAEQLESRTSSRQQSHVSDVSHLSQHMEPLYDTFICSLTKKIMEDPVTIESGVTYEKVAIAEWYSRFNNQNDIVCPKTGQKIVSRTLNSNMALKATIEEWKDRQEVARIKLAMSTLSQASTDMMIFKALQDLGSVCSQKHSNKEQVLSMGILSLLVMLLEYKDRNVRFATLELLLQLVEDADEVKEMVATTVNMTIIMKMLSSNYPPIRHTTLLLLLALSQSKSSCKIIGSINGAILMLITIKYKRSSDAFASERADEILRNLESFPDNIKLMADNGYLGPLLSYLVEGKEEIQMEMASYLGEAILGDDSKRQVAETASPALVKMVQSGNHLVRKASFQALKKISFYHLNSELHIQDEIVKIMVEEIFTQTIHNQPKNSKNEAAAILANIFESGVQVESLEGPTVSLNQIAHKIICSLNNPASDEMNISLIKILLCLTKAPQSSATVVAIIKETEASCKLIELINNTYEELQIEAIKLLISLSPYMGHTLAETLCRTGAQLESLIQMPNERGQISEKHAISANFLAKLPHQNLTLNLALVNMNIVPTVLQAISLFQRSGTRTSRYAIAYSEGLVGILVRFTKTLYDNQVLLLVRNYNFTSLFTELLTTTSSDEVQRLSAVGLENLSIQSTTLSKSPTAKKPKNIKLLFLSACGSSSSSKYKKLSLCPVHSGVCSSQDTFCLLKANTIERLLSCLDHENVGVIEAALSAICTLLDDNVNVDRSISILSEANTIQHVLNVVKEHKEGALWKKSFWIIERFLTNDGDRSASVISQDRLLTSVLVNAFHHGDSNTRQMAESILVNLNKMSSCTTNFPI